jgi:hypothetical protein
MAPCRILFTWGSNDFFLVKQKSKKLYYVLCLECLICPISQNFLRSWYFQIVMMGTSFGFPLSWKISLLLNSEPDVYREEDSVKCSSNRWVSTITSVHILTSYHLTKTTLKIHNLHWWSDSSGRALDY